MTMMDRIELNPRDLQWKACDQGDSYPGLCYSGTDRRR